MGKRPSRRRERERAFQILYGLLFEPPRDADDLSRIFSLTPDPEVLGSAGAEAHGFAWELVQGVWSKQEELDRLVGQYSQHWRIERIARTDLTILRLALYEMLHRLDVPVKVAINEAIELARQFGDENSRGFVNGILDAAAKAIDDGELRLYKGR